MCCCAVVWVEEKGVLVVGGDDGIIVMYSAGGKQLERCKAHDDKMKGLCMMKEALVISIDYNGVVNAWDLDYLKHPLRSFQLQRHLCSVCTLTDTKMALGTTKGEIVVVEWYGERFRHVTTKNNAHRSSVDSMHAFSRFFASGSKDGTLVAMDKTLEILSSFTLDGRCFSVCVVKDYVAAGTRDHIWTFRIRGLHVTQVGKIVQVPVLFRECASLMTRTCWRAAVPVFPW